MCPSIGFRATYRLRLSVESPASGNWVSKYGVAFRQPLTDLQLELRCYRDWHRLTKEYGLTTEWTHHFRQVVHILWGPKNKNKSVEWNPWMEACLEAAHYHPETGEPYPHTGLSGCGSSGKTLYGALHALVNWLCDPVNTMVLVTSTDLKASRKRIWGEITKLYQAAEAAMPGTLIDSQCLIVTVKDGKRLPDTSGISLVAGEKRKEKEAIGKIIGAKNKRVFFIGDELPELTEAVLEAAFSNLVTNPLFQFLAMGNFKSRMDPFGIFIEPVDSYESLTLESTAWITKYGHCVRFDGMKSPNIVGGEDKWKGIYSSKHLAQHRRVYNEHQAGFWRMCRSFEPPIGHDDCIYSEADFSAGKAREHPVWMGDRQKVSSLDPAFTNGGDRSVQHFAWFGQDTTGKYVLDLYKTVLLREDARFKDRTRNFQIAEQFRDNCKAEGVPPRNAAIDATAAGGVFCDIVAELWSKEILRVDFSGAASENLVSQGDVKTAKEKYDRRVSELWYVGVELMKFGQLKGLREEIIREMKARKYDTVKGGDSGLKIRVERKDDMKERLGFSPDEADSYFVMIELCRQRLQFLAAGGFGSASAEGNRDWEREVQLANSVYSDIDYSPQEPFQTAEGF